ncbi:MAG: hypothetical protein J6Y78_16465 [Paludibacteraceae bacterium]|nr:hypothetical protein [Paludibacteraceae bacterium]
MNVSEQEFKFMTECITSDIIQLLMDREHYSLSEAVGIVYDSATYSALLRPESGLYFQSSGYVYEYLRKELDKQLEIKS